MEYTIDGLLDLFSVGGNALQLMLFMKLITSKK